MSLIQNWKRNFIKFQNIIVWFPSTRLKPGIRARVSHCQAGGWTYQVGRQHQKTSQFEIFSPSTGFLSLDPCASLAGSVLLIGSGILHQDPIKANPTRKLLRLLWCTEHLQRHHKRCVGKSLDPGISLQGCTQKTVLVDLVGPWVAYALKDREAPSTGILIVEGHIPELQHQ